MSLLRTILWLLGLSCVAGVSILAIDCFSSILLHGYYRVEEPNKAVVIIELIIAFIALLTALGGIYKTLKVKKRVSQKL